VGYCRLPSRTVRLNLYNYLSVFCYTLQKWHPDRHAHDQDSSALERFQEIQQAYAVLSNSELRHQYDLQYLDILNVEEYLSRFRTLILTSSGLGLDTKQHHMVLQWLRCCVGDLPWENSVCSTRLLTAN
jgi:hypothetical protein